MITTHLSGLLYLEVKTFKDDRGYFRETWRSSQLAEAVGWEVKFCQGNESWSAKPGVIRGLHFQTSPADQAKLVRVNAGAIFDVAVDFRLQSPTFGQWQGFELSAANGASLYIPAGFGHGFCTLNPDTVVSYLVTDYYAPTLEAGIRWDDPELAIDWPVPPEGPLVSLKDAALPLLSEISKNEFFMYT